LDSGRDLSGVPWATHIPLFTPQLLLRLRRLRETHAYSRDSPDSIFFLLLLTQVSSVPPDEGCASFPSRLRELIFLICKKTRMIPIVYIPSPFLLLPPLNLLSSMSDPFPPFRQKVSWILFPWVFRTTSHLSENFLFPFIPPFPPFS